MTDAAPAHDLHRSGVHPGRHAYLNLAVAAVCFGTLWPATKLGLSGATPIWYAAGRMGLGALALFLLLAALGKLRWPARGDLPIIISIGTLQFALFAVLSNIGLRHVPASRSLILAYTTTLWLVPIAFLVGERIGPWRAAGTVLGIGGVAVLFNPLALDWGDRDVVLGNVVLLAAALVWAVGILHARRHRWQLPPLQVLPWQLLLATILTTIAAAILEPNGSVGSTKTALLCLLYIGPIAGPLANWAALSVARDLPMITSSLGLLSAPVLGMIVSAYWLGETIPLALVAGAVMILAGIGLVTIGTVRE